MAKLNVHRIGEINTNRNGTKMEIVEYNRAIDIIVECDDGYNTRLKTSYHQFKKGSLKMPYDKTVHGIGFLGVGKHTDELRKVINRPAYKIWKGMFDRCYVDFRDHHNHVYGDCVVAEEWHNFQNFADWYDENYYTIGAEMMCIDKDIIKKDNKIYSKEFCVFVPQAINKTFTTTKKNRGDLPIGVSRDKNGIRAGCGIGDKKRKFLGYFKTPELAFQSYKTHKENYIKEMADSYASSIPNRLYKAMLSYKVEITD